MTDSTKIIPYKDRMDLYDYIMKIWRIQGKTSKVSCTGMRSFSFWPEHITFDAVDDVLIKSEYWTCD